MLNATRPHKGTYQETTAWCAEFGDASDFPAIEDTTPISGWSIIHAMHNKGRVGGPRELRGVVADGPRRCDNGDDTEAAPQLPAPSGEPHVCVRCGRPDQRGGCRGGGAPARPQREQRGGFGPTWERGPDRAGDHGADGRNEAAGRQAGGHEGLGGECRDRVAWYPAF